MQQRFQICPKCMEESKIYESHDFPQPECSVCSGTGKVLQAAKEKQKDLKDKLFNLANVLTVQPFNLLTL